MELVRATGKNLAQVARELGINDTALGSWVNDTERGVADRTGLLPLTAAEPAELATFSKENAKLKSSGRS